MSPSKEGVEATGGRFMRGILDYGVHVDKEEPSLAKLDSLREGKESCHQFIALGETIEKGGKGLQLRFVQNRGRLKAAGAPKIGRKREVT